MKMLLLLALLFTGCKIEARKPTPPPVFKAGDKVTVIGGFYASCKGLVVSTRRWTDTRSYTLRLVSCNGVAMDDAIELAEENLRKQ